MKTNMGSMLRHGVAALLAALVGANSAAAADKAKQKTFTSPEDAASAVITAAKAGNSKEIAAIFGPGSEKVLQSGDRVADKEARERFAKAAEEANALEKSGDKAILTVGKDKWPFPVPIVKADSGWRFDLEAGKEEILNRRIGQNELFTMQSVLAYADAQREYYTRNPDKSKLLHYAQKMASSPGKRDGLYFPVKSGEAPSPLGPLFDAAKAQGYAGKGADGKPAPYHGYKYKILTGQGPDAKGGAYNYIAGGKMIGGFALVAWPANYGNSGVMSFMVNHDGVVYEKDLGPGTEAAAQKITKFNPDKTWKVVEQPGKK